VANAAPVIRFRHETLERPESWRYGLEDGRDVEDALKADYDTLLAQYARLRVQSCFVEGQENRGAGMFVARLYPATPGERFVAVVEASVDPASETMPKTKMVRIGALREEGWEPWQIPEDPTTLQPTGEWKDERRVQRANDVFTWDNPAADTMRLFPGGIELSDIGAMDGDWKEGRLMRGKSTLSRGACLEPAQTADCVSATSLGQVPKIARPGDIGMGWADYDYFGSWQSYGRELQFEEDCPPTKDWESTPEPVEFQGSKTQKLLPVPLVGVDTDGPRVTIRGNEPKMLWERMKGPDLDDRKSTRDAAK
jgi:hypothetical protein